MKTKTELQSYIDKVKQSAAWLKEKCSDPIDYLIIIGSGLGQLSDILAERVTVPYSEIPNFPVSTVQGHSGEMHFGKLCGKNVMIMKGRFHLYEGYDAWEVVFPIRVAKELGVSKMVVTNAAGGINPNYDVADIMLIKDHINWMGTNPLIGPNNDYLGERFPDMCDAYSKEFRKSMKEIALDNKIAIREGVYLASTGPTYETKAEIGMFIKIGADAVGMSTIPEVISAVNCGFQTLGLSYISNVHKLGVEYSTTHEEVIENSKLVTKKLITLVTQFIEKN